MSDLRGTLSTQDIASAIETIEGFVRGNNIERRVALGIPLVAEEVLLRYRDALGEDARFTLDTVKRFGVLTVRIALRGPSLDVLQPDDYGDNDMINVGLGQAFVASVLGDGFGAPIYTYRGGENVITMQARLQHQRPFWRDPMVIALVIALIAGFAVRNLSPDTASFLAESVAGRLSSLFLGVLSGITGPLVGMSLLSGICAFGSISALKEIGTSAITRLMAWSTILFLLAVGLSLPFFSVLGVAGEGAFSPGELVDLLLSAIPTNLFKPFVENNALQIAVLSLFVGICILAMGEQADSIGKLIVELNGVAFKMMSVISRGLPVLVGLSVFKTIASTDVSQIASLAKIVLVSFFVVGVSAVGMMVFFCVRHRVSAPVFLNKIAPVLLITLATGSGTASLGENYRVCEDELGISKNITTFWIPLAQALFAPSLATPLVISMFAVAEMAGETFSVGRLLILFVLVFQLSIASPKVPGGIAATFTILLAQLGLPLDSVGILIAANVFVVNVESAFGVLVREIEICSFAMKQNAIDRAVFDAK